MNILADELAQMYEEVPPMEFYREVFPEGELDEYRENPEQREGYLLIHYYAPKNRVYKGFLGR